MNNKSLIYLFSKIFSAFLNLLIIYLFTRFFSTKLYGEFLLFSSYVLFISSFVFWWHRLSVYRYFHKFKSILNNYLKTTYISFYYICFLIIFLIFILFILDFKNILIVKNILLISLIAALFKSNFDLNQNLLNISKKDVLYGINVILRPLLFLIICLLIKKYYPDENNTLFFGFILSFFLGSVYSNYLFQSKMVGGFFDYKIIRKFCSYGFPLTGLFLFDYILTSSDRIIIGYFLGPESVGIYGANYDLIKQFLLFLMIVQNLILYPELNKKYEQKDYNDVKKLMSLNLAVFYIIFAPLVFFIAIFSDLISGTFIGSDFNYNSSILIPIFSLTFFLWGLKIYHFDYIFFLKEKTFTSMKILFFGSLINFILNVIAIPKFGIVGASVSTLFSYLICLIASYNFGRSFLKYSFNSSLLLKTILILIILSSLTLILKNLKIHFLYQVVFFIVSYCFLFFKYNSTIINEYLVRFYK